MIEGYCIYTTNKSAYLKTFVRVLDNCTRTAFRKQKTMDNINENTVMEPTASIFVAFNMHIQFCLFKQLTPSVIDQIAVF